MLKYIVKRILCAIPLLLGISIIIFGLIKMMPGNPFDMYLENPNVSFEEIEKIKIHYGLDKPLPVQYVKWIGNVAKGDWGISYSTKRPVLEMLMERVGPTLKLTGTAFLLSALLAIPLGVLGAIKKNSIVDYTTTALTFLGISMPVFWFGLMLQLIFSVELGWLPSAGMTSFGPEGGTFIDVATHLIMPSIVLALIYIASWSRYTRTSFLDSMGQDYIRTARAKGLKESSVYGKHALRNALVPLMTIIALDIPALFSGAVVTETVFAWPGMGRFFMDSLNKLDYPVLMGILMINAFLVIICNILADVIYAVLDPRIKY